MSECLKYPGGSRDGKPPGYSDEIYAEPVKSFAAMDLTGEYDGPRSAPARCLNVWE